MLNFFLNLSYWFRFNDNLFFEIFVDFFFRFRRCSINLLKILFFIFGFRCLIVDNFDKIGVCLGYGGLLSLREGQFIQIIL